MNEILTPMGKRLLKAIEDLAEKKGNIDNEAKEIVLYAGYTITGVALPTRHADAFKTLQDSNYVSLDRRSRGGKLAYYYGVKKKSVSVLGTQEPIIIECEIDKVFNELEASLTDVASCLATLRNVAKKRKERLQSTEYENTILKNMNNKYIQNTTRLQERINELKFF